MLKEELLEKIKVLEEKREILFKKKEPIDRMLIRHSKEIEKTRAELEAIEMATPMTEAEEIEYFLFEDGKVSGDRYKTREKFWRKFGLLNSGYFYETEQVALKIALTYGDPKSLENHIQAIEKVLPYVKPFKSGFKKFDIFEHTLSQYDSYDLCIKDDEYVINSRWSKKKFNTLEEALKYIQENLWYDGKEENTDASY